MSKSSVTHWFLFSLLSIIWGSSFILMKVARDILSGYEIAALRIFSASIVCIPFAAWHLRKLPKGKWGWVFLSGIAGSLFPALCFGIAISHRIDSALASIINAVTPMWVLFFGLLAFKRTILRQQLVGVFVGFAGVCLLLLAWKGVNLDRFGYASLVVLATVFYGLNVNLVSSKLQQLPPLSLTIVALSMMAVPSGLVLWQEGYFQRSFDNHVFLTANAAILVLGVLGTAFATVIFYYLVQKAGGLFASLTTYAIPVVALLWGVLDGEPVNAAVIGCMGIILLGVYLVNRKNPLKQP